MVTMNTASDARLVRETLQGETDSFNGLVERYLGVAQALAFAHVRTHADAEDVAQESFLKAYESLDTLRDPAKFGSWLGAIVRHTAARIKERRLRDANYIESQDQSDSVVVPDPGQQEFRAQIRKEIEKLDVSMREVIVLHYFAGKSSKEISEILDVKPTTVRKRLQRARESLGERLLEQAVIEVSPDKKRVVQIMALIAATSVNWRAAEAATAGAAKGFSLGGTTIAKIAAVTLVIVVAIALPILSYVSAEPTAGPASEEAGAVPSAEMEPTTTAVAMADPAAEPAAAPTPQAANADSEDGYLWRMHGLAVDENGEILEGAVIRLALKSSSYKHRIEAPLHFDTVRSDENGRFEFTDIPLERGKIFTAELRGTHGNLYAYTPYGSPRSPVTDPRYLLWFYPTESIAGIVKDEFGAPVAGANVTSLNYEAGQNWLFRFNDYTTVECDDQGRFSFPRLFAGQWTFVAKAEGFAPAISKYFPTGTNDARIEIRKGRTLAGIVVDSTTNTPVENVRFEIHARGGYMVGDYEVTSDANGRFEIEGIRIGRFHRIIQDSMYFDSEFEGRIEVLADQPVTQITIPVEKGGGTLSGRLFDEDSGEGISGVRVTASLDDPRRRRSRSSITTADGEFTILGLKRGEYSLAHSKNANMPVWDWHPESSPSGIHVGDGETVTGIEFPVSRRRRVSGIIVDDEGKPCPDVSVSIVFYSLEDRILGSPDQLDPTGDPWTNEDGAFSVFVPKNAKSFRIHAGKPGWTTGALHSMFLDEEGARDLKLTLFKAAAISGEIHDAEGQRMRGRIEFQVTGTESAGYITHVGMVSITDGSRSVLEITSFSPDESGRFYLGSLAPDTYTISNGDIETSVTVEAGEHRDGIILQMASPNSGRISGRATYRGEPIGNVYVHADTYGRRRGGAAVPQVQTSPDGTYLISGMTEGLYGFRAYVSLRRDGVEVQHTYSRRRLALDSQSRLEIDVPFAAGTGSVEGRVTLDGEPVSRLMISTSIDWDNGFTEEIEARTNMDGEYNILGLPERIHTLKIGTPLEETPVPIRENVEVETHADSTTQFDIVYETASLTVDIGGVKPGETTAVTLIAGEYDVDEITPAAYERLEWTALVIEQNVGDSVTIPKLPGGIYTVLVGAYDDSQPDDLSTFATLRYASKLVEISPGYENRIRIDIE